MAALLHRYARDGYAVSRRGIEKEQVDQLRRIVETELPFLRGGPAMLQRLNVWLDHPEILDFIVRSGLAEMASKLLGARHIRLWHDQVLVKPGPHGAESPWHQDHPYWPLNELDVCSFWIALDNTDGSSGSMTFVPGSHRHGYLSFDTRALRQWVGHARTRPVRIDLEPGQFTVHHGLLVHGARPNLARRDRRAFKVVLMGAGTTYRPRPHPLTDPLGLLPGQPLSDTSFPILK